MMGEDDLDGRAGAPPSAGDRSGKDVVRPRRLVVAEGADRDVGGDGTVVAAVDLGDEDADEVERLLEARLSARAGGRRRDPAPR
ncbi:MAG: hypothetical protein GVY33_08865 [Alphaproteobacteria bacterium]|nr:hypothetical protein [Alphaproteobacteria bacterium]